MQCVQTVFCVCFQVDKVGAPRKSCTYDLGVVSSIGCGREGGRLTGSREQRLAFLRKWGEIALLTGRRQTHGVGILEGACNAVSMKPHRVCLWWIEVCVSNLWQTWFFTYMWVMIYFYPFAGFAQHPLKTSAPGHGTCFSFWVTPWMRGCQGLVYSKCASVPQCSHWLLSSFLWRRQAPTMFSSLSELGCWSRDVNFCACMVVFMSLAACIYVAS